MSDETQTVEALRWAAMDACTGAQMDSPTFKRLYPNGMSVGDFNRALCDIATEIENAKFCPLYEVIALREKDNK